MAANIAGYNRPFGLRPFRNLAGPCNPIGRKQVIVSASHCLLAGDPVAVDTAGTVIRFPASATAAMAMPYGVITGVYNSYGRPMTHNTAGPSLNLGEQGYVDVVPFTANQTFLVALGQKTSASTEAKMLGMRCNFGHPRVSDISGSIGANATLMGVSLFCLTSTSGPTNYAAGASASVAEYNSFRRFHGMIVSFPGGGVDVGESRFPGTRAAGNPVLSGLTDDTLSLVEVMVEGVYGPLGTRLPI